MTAYEAASLPHVSVFRKLNRTVCVQMAPPHHAADPCHASVHELQRKQRLLVHKLVQITARSALPDQVPKRADTSLRVAPQILVESYPLAGQLLGLRETSL